MAFILRKNGAFKICQDLKLFSVCFSHPRLTDVKYFNSYFVALKPKTQPVKAAYTGLGLGLLMGGTYQIYTMQTRPEETPVEFSTPPIITTFPDVPISRQILIPTDASGLKLTLFQYPTCPFCCKVRAFLDYFGISYNVVEVDPVLRQQIKWSKYKKVPIILVEVEGGYQQLCDSSMVISALTTYLKDKNKSIKEIAESYPTVTYTEKGDKKAEVSNKYYIMGGEISPDEKLKQQLQDERKWRIWADDVLVHMLSPNVYRTRKEAMQAFNWFSEVGEWDRLFPVWERMVITYVGANVMWMIGKKLKKKHNLLGDVRTSLYDTCKQWTKELNSRQTPFLGGSTPNLGDLSVYGVLSSIEGCQTFSELLANTKIGPWYFSMKDAVQNHQGNAKTI